MTSADLLPRIMALQDLTADQATALMYTMLDDSVSEATKAALLTAWRMKGETGDELAACVQVLQQQAIRVPDVPVGTIDTCGTGGGIASFNISTAAAIVVAACGIPVAKHGNRAVTSKCGSADVLEALGLKLAETPERASHELNEVGISFLFAPHFHPAMAKVRELRKTLGVRTAFNLFGPLANPAAAKLQLVGVMSLAETTPVGIALARLGCERAWVVHGMDGLDEVSPTAITKIVEVQGMTARPAKVTPKEFDVDASQVDISPGVDLAHAAQIVRDAVSGKDRSRTEAIVPSAAAAVYLAQKEPTFKLSAARVREAIAAGDAERLLEKWIDVSRSA